jgi:hypothetical protein
MSDAPAILANYPNRRHFLQLVNIPVFGTPFLYMKNHKAACTTVLASLMANLNATKDGPPEPIDMGSVHAPPKSLLLTGSRGLTVRRALRWLNDPDVFRFTVVREPVARTVSAYADKIVKGDKQKTRLMRHLGRRVEADLSLSEFLDILAQDPAALDLDRHWRPQRKEVSWDQIEYDYVGDMADLPGAMALILNRIFGPSAQPPEDTRRSFGHKSHSQVLIEGMTAADRRNIERALEGDFEMYESVRHRLAEAS